MYSGSDSSPTNASTSTTQEQHCRAIDEQTGNVCGETESLHILHEFHKVYESRIQKVDKELLSEGDRSSAKLQIMKEWINDLEEQNIMLVRTVDDLEQSAGSRVKLLEEKLKQSSRAVTDSMTKSTITEESLNKLKTHITKLENDDQHLQDKIKYLQNDIRGLLEFIRRARCNNCWKTEGIRFFEISPDDILNPPVVSSKQDELDSTKIPILNEQIKKLQENKEEMFVYQKDLEGKLLEKEETIKKQDDYLKYLTEKLKKCSPLTNQGTLDTTIGGSDCDIMTVGDFTESTLADKDLTCNNLKQQLEESKAMVAKLLSEKHRYVGEEIHQFKCQMANIRKECVETQEILKAQIKEKDDLITHLRKHACDLQKQCHLANIEMQFKDEIIKEIYKELKKTAAKALRPAGESQMEYPTVHCDALELFKKDKIVSCLMDTKLLMEQQSLSLCDLKMALTQILETDSEKRIKGVQQSFNMRSMEELLKCDNGKVIDNQSRTNLSEICTCNVRDVLKKNLENVDKMCTEKKEAIACIDSIVKDCHEVHMSAAHDATNTVLTAVLMQHLIFMQEFRFCTVQAQAATEDIREQIDSVVATFNYRHQKYMDLANTVTNVQDQLVDTRKTLWETIKKLELRDEEQTRYCERIGNGEKNLKDLKNNINRVQSDLACHVNKMQDYTTQKHSEVYMCNDLLLIVVEEIEEVMNNLQAFQAQSRCTTSVLAELKRQLDVIESTLKELQRKTEAALLENTLAEATFAEREKRLAKLEAAVDSAHTTMQEMVEVFEATKQGSVPNFFSNNQAQCQFINDILKTKEELRNMKKENHNHRIHNFEHSCEASFKESINQWKCRISELEDQIRVLQQEAKSKEEINRFLKQTNESLKKELLSVQTKWENYRRCHTIDNLDLKQKILSLENTVKTQKEVESNLRISLNNSEMELRKSREHSDSHIAECGSESAVVQIAYPTNIPLLFKLLQDTIQMTRSGLQELKANLKKIICQDSSSHNASPSSMMLMIDKVEKYEENLEICSQEIEKLKCTLRSKDKLLEHRDERIRIQKGSIEMMQAELKELTEKSHQKIDVAALIAKYEKEKQELAKQNELQTQTIRHLQDAFVEAKRSFDQKAQKGMQEKDNTIFALRLFVDETQSQYHDCFTEAAKQEKLMDLQRNAIETLQERVRRMDYDKCSLFAMLHLKYYSVFNFIQEKLCVRANDLEALKCKVDIIVDSKSFLEQKYANMKELWRQTHQELQELKCIARNGHSHEKQNCHCKSDGLRSSSNNQSLTTDNKSSTYVIKKMQGDFAKIVPRDELNRELDEFIVENNNLRKQLHKCQLDIELFEKELKSDQKYDSYITTLKNELQQIRNTECDLKCENNHMKLSLQEQTNVTANLSSEVQRVDDDGKMIGSHEIHEDELGLAIVKNILQEQDGELERLAENANQKQEELKMLHTIKTEFEKVNELEKVNASLHHDLTALKSKNKGKDVQIMQFAETVGYLHDSIELQSEKVKNLHNQTICNEVFIKEQLQNVEELQLKLGASNQQLEKCVTDLNTSKKIIFIMRNRINSLTVLLKEKSDSTVKLEADYEMLKNSNIILKRQMQVAQTISKDDVYELKKKLKQVEAELYYVNDNYEKASGDFHKAQQQLVNAAKREADLQESLTTIEKDYCQKLIAAERESAKLSDLVNMLTEELSDSRRKLSQSEDKCKMYTEQFETAQRKLNELNEKVQEIETVNYNLTSQLHECLSEKLALAQQKASLEHNNYKCIAELQEMDTSLAAFKKECHLKSLSLACMSMSTSELRNESQYTVSCIRAWMNEQKDLVDHLTSKLDAKQQLLAKFNFEKRSLLAIIRELKRTNNVLMQKLRRTRRSVGIKRAKCMNQNNYTTPSHSSDYPCLRLTSVSNHSNVHKKCCSGSVNSGCRASSCHNSWELPQMEQLVNKLRKNNCWWRKDFLNKKEQHNDAGTLEENHDCGYQSSASK